MPGIKADVEIVRDKWGIPHIRAKTLDDMLFAQGFVQAQDRFFQMEVSRRIANGELAEVLGPGLLQTDRAARVFGFGRLARAAVGKMAPGTLANVASFVAGINEYLARSKGSLPVEFSLLNFSPRPWKVEDSVAIMQFVAWSLVGHWYGELVRTWLEKAVGKEHAAELDYHGTSYDPVVLPAGIEFNMLGASGILKAVRGPYLRPGGASNAWAISGALTGTGMPLLCNDPHLAIGTPGFFCGQHLSCKEPEGDAIGVQIPGLPFLVIGHNDRIAWGFTTGWCDSADLYVEKMNPDNPNQYEQKGKWNDCQVVEEKINVKKSAPHVERVLATCHGPIISDVVGSGNLRVSSENIALRPTGGIETFARFFHARNWNDFVDGVKVLGNINQNITYADVEGNIGYYLSGAIPIRPKGMDGRHPMPGWTGEWDWLGDIPFEEMPHALNPKKGFIVNANNKVVPDDFKHFIGDYYCLGYRARRITDLIEGLVTKKEPATIESMKRIQLDTTNLAGLEFAGHVKGLESADPDVAYAREQLATWDGRADASSIAQTLYWISAMHVLKNIVFTGLDKKLAVQAFGMGFDAIILAFPEFGTVYPARVLDLLRNENSWWVKQAGGKAKLLENGIKDGMAWLRRNRGENRESWRWGKAGACTFAHSMASVKALDFVLSVRREGVSGAHETVRSFGNIPLVMDGQPGSGWFGSVLRMVVDMKNLDQSVFVFGPGQSGHLASAHYQDLADLWIRGEYIPMAWTRAQVDAIAEKKLVLRP
ncbi:MAG: penicillin acylase family protein [Candidatus Lokiarchaeota archaeon]|nr:penicillin acylase family protein [Candidatus Lokiarchaeota archaeon]